MTAPSRNINFRHSPGPTIGVEAELFLIDKETCDLADGAPTILEACRDDPRVKPELLQSLIEINTGICANIGEVRDDLEARIARVIGIAAGHNIGLASMGTHPFARWSDARVTQHERYRGILERMQFPVRRLLIAGLHVHIGIENGEQAIAVVNGLLHYVPHLIALSANSPYWDGEATGLASTRTKVFESMPTVGTPPRLSGYGEYEQLVGTLLHAGAIESIRDIWWDIRPHPGFGTVEVRLMDAVPTVTEMVALAALTQCLVVDLARKSDRGEMVAPLPEWVVGENKWRAVRHGMDADVITGFEGRQRSLRAEMTDLLDILAPVAVNLNCADMLHHIEKVVRDGHPGIRQVERYEQTEDLKAVVKLAMDDLEGSV